jgi:hypothetical protein
MDPEAVNTQRLLDVITIFGLIAIAGVLLTVRRERIRVEYSVSWLLAAAALLVLGRWRGLDEWLAAALGAGSVGLVLVMLAGAAFLFVLYRLSLLVSDLKDSNIKLTQRIAFLEFRLEALHEKNGTAAR